MTDIFDGLTPPYQCIVADPPWNFTYRGGGSWKPGREEGMGYSTMPLEDICALPVADLAAPDAWLFLWVTRGLYRRGAGVKVAQAWGFPQDVAEIIWEKPQFGTGAFPRPCHEPVLIARRGSPKSPVDRTTRSVQKWAPRSRLHSAKPDALGDLVEQHFPGPYLELFSRAPRLGWDAWGKGFEMEPA